MTNDQLLGIIDDALDTVVPTSLNSDALWKALEAGGAERHEITMAIVDALPTDVVAKLTPQQVDAVVIAAIRAMFKAAAVTTYAGRRT